MILCIITLLGVAGIQTATVVPPYSPLGASLSATAMLYSSEVAIPAGALQTYAVHYVTPFSSSPEVIYSLSSLEDDSDFSASYVKTSFGNPSPLLSFEIYVMLSGTASVFKLGISYMALVDQYSAIFILTT